MNKLPRKMEGGQGSGVSRRGLLRNLGLTGLAAGGAAALPRLLGGTARAQGASASAASTPPIMGPHAIGAMMPHTVGEVNHAANGFNPTDLLTDFDYGKISRMADGRTLREYELVAEEKTIEIVPGVTYPAWTYNGRIPGPTIRATEGNRLRIHFRNATARPHSAHFHGIHPFPMDGVPGAGPGPIPPGGEFTYEFDAEPFGLHLYHCHTFPLSRHIAKGMYGAFIVDPKQGRARADREFVMVMAGFDLDFDDSNDVYAVNTIPFHYQKNPIPITVGELVRVYLVNILEFDPINSFHLHANFFHYYPTGTSLTPSEFTDVIMQAQAQRGILEFRYKFPGTFMFHAHKTEFAELGWNGSFHVAAAEGV